jgi:hypothetical protein
MATKYLTLESKTEADDFAAHVEKCAVRDRSYVKETTSSITFIGSKAADVREAMKLPGFEDSDLGRRMLRRQYVTPSESGGAYTIPVDEYVQTLDGDVDDTTAHTIDLKDATDEPVYPVAIADVREVIK